MPRLMDLTSEPFSFEFVFGIGLRGLTPFESEFAGKAVGETFTLMIERS